MYSWTASPQKKEKFCSIWVKPFLSTSTWPDAVMRTRWLLDQYCGLKAFLIIAS